LGYGGAVLHLGSRARVVFAAAWITGQIALILTAAARPDHIFGFRMFPEASTMEIHLSREVGGGEVPAPRGEWKARDRAGQVRSWSWSDRVRDGVLGRVDVRVFASYGVDAQLFRLQHALDDEVDHIADDTQTKRLVAKVDYWKNGRDRCTVTLHSHARAVL
jgi:hypothetical protein